MKSKVLGIAVLVLAVLCIAAKDHKPRRGTYYIAPEEKWKVVEETVEIRDQVEEAEGFFEEIKNDGQLKPWANWWHQCTSSFNVNNLIDVGTTSISDEPRTYDKEELAGPNRKFTISRGGRTINPVWGRMKYVKTADGWEPTYGNRCGVVMYEKGKAQTLIHCGELDGIFGGYFAGKDKVVVTAYRKTSPEMNTECKAQNVGECVSPVLYLIDLKDQSVWQYRGPVVMFKKCEPNNLLIRLYPSFFIQPEEEAAAKAKAAK